MELLTTYITPVQLTGYIRRSLDDLEKNQLVLGRYLPSQTINDLEYRFNTNQAGLLGAAVYRAWDTESPLGKRPGISRVSGELPPISEKMRVGEYLRLRQRNLPGEVTNAILDDADLLTRRIAKRIELARADALLNGSVTIAENGVTAAVDFERDSSMEVTASPLWDGSSPTPMEDLLAWVEDYVELNGSEPGVILTSRKVVNTLMRDDEFRNIIFPNSSTSPALVTRESINTALGAFGLPPITTYDAQLDVGGTATRYIPDNKLLLLPSPGSVDGAQLGKTLWGVTAESLESEFGLLGNEPGIVGGSYSTKDPVAVWTKAAAIALPIVANANLTMVATVLS